MARLIAESDQVSAEGLGDVPGKQAISSGRTPSNIASTKAHPSRQFMALNA